MHQITWKYYLSFTDKQSQKKKINVVLKNLIELLQYILSESKSKTQDNN